uniref:Uncharacterized protein n=1 Tax=Rhizophora mucronata TaxID=61149 RepID=A0A2P2QZ83_RHIMU
MLMILELMGFKSTPHRKTKMKTVSNCNLQIKKVMSTGCLTKQTAWRAIQLSMR